LPETGLVITDLAEQAALVWQQSLTKYQAFCFLMMPQQSTHEKFWPCSNLVPLENRILALA
jgi:hypothetical protein